MNRRDTVFALVALGLTGAALRARAQAPSKSFRLGILRQTSATDPLTAMLRGALAEVGYVEGQNIAVEWRFADGRADRLPALAVELVKLNPHALATGGDLSIRALRQATTNIPIVAVSDDMVAEGHVASLPRPGGNITGVTILASELNAKRLYLLKEAVPRASRFAALWHPSSGTFHQVADRLMNRDRGDCLISVHASWLVARTMKVSPSKTGRTTSRGNSGDVDVWSNMYFTRPPSDGYEGLFW
jgi:putative ABC transport system substrate-binding protein